MPDQNGKTRILLFTGKGGVGKTTTAAASALAAADAGHRTMVVSTDPAHSLADAFGVELGPLAVEIAPGLYGEQLDAQERMEESWGEIQEYLSEVFRWAGLGAIEAEELSVIPGLDEVFALTDIKRHSESGEYDVLVVDCAPTAETIRFLSLPDVLGWYMQRLFPVGRRVNRMVAPLLGRVTDLPVAGDSTFAAVARFHERLDGVKEILSDVERTSVRLVVNPERMVIAEARRTATYLSLFGYRVDAVVANRLLPDSVSDPWFEEWKRLHAEHLVTIEEGFAPLPVLRAELAPHELIGFERLREFAKTIYGTTDPADRLSDGDALTYSRRGDATVLDLELPFADRDDIELGRHDDELIVSIGPYRRAILLPDSLKGRDVTDATLKKGRLTVVFAEESTS